MTKVEVNQSNKLSFSRRSYMWNVIGSELFIKTLKVPSMKLTVETANSANHNFPIESGSTIVTSEINLAGQRLSTVYHTEQIDFGTTTQIFVLTFN